MTRAEYLTERGWRRSGAFPGNGADQWYDAKGGKVNDMSPEDKANPMRVEVAHAIQLDRDATLRDYVNQYRPVTT